MGGAEYRPEIDGLRAIAVGSVILFHAGVSALPGGFLGVDIFFVISGYLITSILVRDMDRGSFSVLRFYERRLRRIVPALNVMMIAASVAFLPLLLPDDLENFGQSLIATTAFSNNVLLFLTTDYFDLSAEFKPLMHTWSLGVEEHYYIFAPIALWIGARIAGRKGAFYSSLLIFTASLLACVLLAGQNPDANFYLVTSRAWELAAGAMVATWSVQRRPTHAVSNAFAVIGIVMVLLPLFILGEKNNLPNWPTLIPVAGSCLLLRFSESETGIGRILSARPLVWGGLLSYSAYLYHQPVFVLARVTALEAPRTWQLLALTPVVFALAFLSWRFVEQPFRTGDRPARLKLFMFCGVTSGALMMLGATLYFTSGFYQYRPELSARDPGFGARQNVAFSHRADAYRGKDLSASAKKPNVLVVGNSFARDLVNMGLEAGGFEDFNVSYLHVDECEEITDRELASARWADLVVLAVNFSAEEIGCVARLKTQVDLITGRAAHVLGPKNFGWNNNAVMLLPPDTRYATHVPPLPDVIMANEAGRAAFGGHYIDLLAVLMDDEGKVPVFTPDRQFISQDRIHLTEAGAAWVGRNLFETVKMQDLIAHARTASRVRNARTCPDDCPPTALVRK